MSLARIALRATAVEALKGRTRALNNVLDSEIGIIDSDSGGNVTIEADQYFIAIYTDAGKTQVGDNELRSLLLNGRTEIMFETGVTASMGVQTRTPARSDFLKLASPTLTATLNSRSI